MSVKDTDPKGFDRRVVRRTSHKRLAVAGFQGRELEKLENVLFASFLEIGERFDLYGGSLAPVIGDVATKAPAKQPVAIGSAASLMAQLGISFG